MLIAAGLIMVFSASTIRAISAGESPYAAYLKNLGIMIIGVLLMIFVSRISVTWLKKSAVLLLGISLTLQSLIFTGLAVSEGGNTNWVKIPGVPFLFQPSETLKLTLAVYLAWAFSTQLKNRRDLKALGLWIGLPVVASLAMIMWGSDLGTTMIIATMVLGMLMVAGIPSKYYVYTGATAVFLVTLAVASKPSRLERIISVIPGQGPERNLAAPEQIDHALWALGSGGLSGVGPGASKEKWNYLAAAHTDFIFAVLGEELGFFGAISIILAFACLLYGIYRLALSQTTVFERLVVTGMFSWIGAQTLVNLGAVVNLTPIIGVPLPLISTGGTAFLATTFCLGVVLSIARQNVGDGHSFGIRGIFRSFLS